MSHILRWVQQFQNFEDAYQTFGRVYERYRAAPDDEVIQIALIQAFEFNFEIAWKTMKDYLEYEGYSGVNSSKQVVRVAFQSGLVTSPKGWMTAIARRNMTSHVFNTVVLQEMINFIRDEFRPLVQALYSELSKAMSYGLSDQQLKEIIQFIAAYPQVEEAILFGSRALGTHKPASDVDIAIKGKGATSALATRLKFDIEEDTYLPYFFDVVAYGTITHAALRQHIDKEGVSIYYNCT
ncbi:nucleotidyltransferase substrate binding protein [Nodosilinea sp. LEGE 07298]|uniref:HI0074 family nucleotidyltransferase substrate-binding subunit n=1 Tax=Nodosilinea sp. LEGE 07298 TaxID=2777970 RepID=UPI00188279A4|nr:HI0074 family nucleotidyltransferase substrate-binding subunit [Nodosilinea sp. LEGE 07298]MBE9113253.1 nucleotidyltransferase substrate binding protein [Nodosilinea sp. LEGE 07298]